ncbi:hypothetical protein FQN53_000348 [Emmonsiellopsis sp. PD_33]|nr:hypothetical protein FQN53_000348 [Emmonsiellopsis sp. PD_33]
MVRPFGSQGTGIIRNPLIDRTEHDLTQDVQRFHEAQQLGDAIDLDMLVKGAKIGRDPTRIGSLDGITAAERQILLEEVEARKRKSVRDLFRQTKGLHITILVTACAAISQGWQQSVINASSDLWEDEFWKGVKYNLRDRRLKVGAINAFPFLSGSLIGAWLSDPLQETRMGRRLALFLAALFSVACSIWSYRCNDWKELMACRIVLGLGIGTKASVAPVFAAEAAVDHLRGRVLMMWQLFDAFGIFLGFVCALITGEDWQTLLGTALIPPALILILVATCPESPRFLIRQRRYKEAYRSLCRLRRIEVQAARDLYYIHSQLQVETELWTSTSGPWYNGKLHYQDAVHKMTFFHRVWYLFAIPRNRRACWSAFLVMISQQMCGHNILAFYSTTVFKNAGAAEFVGWLNFGVGLSVFLFTFPAYLWIDSRGRRFLLLVSLAGMSVSLLGVSFCFTIGDDTGRRVAVALLAILPFTFFYAIGAGPVPFTFSAEVFPLAFREVGMSFSVMVNFAGLGLLVLLLPYYTRKLGGQGDEADEADEADGQKKMLLIFTGFNVIAFILVFLIVPSTAEPNLEEMNDIFAVSTAEHVNFQARERLPWLVRRYVLHNEGDERTLVEWQKEAQTSESNSIPLERRNSTEGV